MTTMQRMLLALGAALAIGGSATAGFMFQMTWPYKGVLGTVEAGERRVSTQVWVILELEAGSAQVGPLDWSVTTSTVIEAGGPAEHWSHTRSGTTEELLPGERTFVTYTVWRQGRFEAAAGDVALASAIEIDTDGVVIDVDIFQMGTVE